MSIQPITCKLCGKQIPEGLPIVGEPPENARRRKVQNMTIHMQDKHPVSFQTALTTGMLCGQTIPAIMLAADFDLPDEMEQQRQSERARIAKLVRRVTLSDAQLEHLLTDSLATEHIGDALWLLKDLRDRYEEIGEYAPEGVALAKV